jgi:hypothetical protein
MKLESVLQFCYAAHWSIDVRTPFTTRSGILLIAQPDCLKTTIVTSTLNNTPKALCYSDLTLQQLVKLRAVIAGSTCTTLGFFELEKLYARNADTASNVEGVIKAMVEEGFSHAAFEDKRVWVPTARCLVIAATLQSLYSKRFASWEESGFLRRFVQIKYSLHDRSKLHRAQKNNQLFQFPKVNYPGPRTSLPMSVTSAEHEFLLELGPQMASGTRMLLMRRVLTILKWKHGSKKALAILNDMSDALSEDGGELIL